MCVSVFSHLRQAPGGHGLKESCSINISHMANVSRPFANTVHGHGERERAGRQIIARQAGLVREAQAPRPFTGPQRERWPGCVEARVALALNMTVEQVFEAGDPGVGLVEMQAEALKSFARETLFPTDEQIVRTILIEERECDVEIGGDTNWGVDESMVLFWGHICRSMCVNLNNKGHLKMVGTLLDAVAFELHGMYSLDARVAYVGGVPMGASDMSLALMQTVFYSSILPAPCMGPVKAGGFVPSLAKLYVDEAWPGVGSRKR